MYIEERDVDSPLYKSQNKIAQANLKIGENVSWGSDLWKQMSKQFYPSSTYHTTPAD